MAVGCALRESYQRLLKENRDGRVQDRLGTSRPSDAATRRADRRTHQYESDRKCCGDQTRGVAQGPCMRSRGEGSGAGQARITGARLRLRRSRHVGAIAGTSRSSGTMLSASEEFADFWGKHGRDRHVAFQANVPIAKQCATAGLRDNGVGGWRRARRRRTTCPGRLRPSVARRRSSWAEALRQPELMLRRWPRYAPHLPKPDLRR